MTARRATAAAPKTKRSLTPPAPAAQLDTPTSVEAIFRRMKALQLSELPASLELRLDRLRRLRAAVLANKAKIIETVTADFGGRSPTQSMLAEVFVPIAGIDHAIKHVSRWMKPQKRSPNFPFGLIGGKAEIISQPLGIIGVLAPWNAPYGLVFTPLSGILAAGNRAIIKPSEFTPRVAQLIADIIASAFSADEVAVVQGEADVAQALVSLPLDHILFTGGAKTARHVMRAASANLVPVTLELGGKSPAIVGPGADVAIAAAKIMNGKLSNSGQVCMCPDFSIVHEDAIERFVAAAKAATQRMYPDPQNNPDYTNVFGGPSVQRLMDMVREAQAGGAKVIPLVDGWTLESVTDTSQSCPFPPLAVIDPPLDSKMMTTEVFGPILPVVRYRSLDVVIADLRKSEPPLALYYFGSKQKDIDKVLSQTVSGGVTINDVMLHPLMEELPFGGVGESGMGRYKGEDGFRTFSHQKSVYKAGWLDITSMMAPPYGKLMEFMFKGLK